MAFHKDTKSTSSGSFFILRSNMQAQLEPHELAEFYPMQDPARFSELVEGMRKSGYRDEFPIVTYEGRILDGRNRYRAAIEAGVEPYIVQFGGDDPVDFVIQANSNRRDLTAQQRAAIGLSFMGYLREKGKQNMSVGGRDKGLTTLSNHVPVNARKKAAEMVGVSEGTMAAVIKIEKEQPDLIKKIARGEMTVTEARKIIDPIPHVSHNSGENEWYTPDIYISSARAVLGTIDIDPASSELANKTVKATRYYTKIIDGVSQEWRGKCWMNPPYSTDEIRRFIEKYAESVKSGSVTEGIVLVNNATETNWFSTLIGVSTAVVFPCSRIKFIDKNGVPNGAPLQGQAFLYAGNNPRKFLEVFTGFGWGAELWKEA